jgi:hypothetical protein
MCFILIPFLIFLFYDRKVTRQQERIISSANRSHAIVSSLYPAAVRDKIYPLEKSNGGMGMTLYANPSLSSPPIAELYPETTVLFAGTLLFGNFYTFSCLFLTARLST